MVSPNETTTMKLNANALGLAVGMTGILFYVLCMLLMWIGGADVTATFFNSLLHGLDVHEVMRMSVPAGETVMGLILTFVLGWLGGYFIALLYNRFS